MKSVLSLMFMLLPLIVRSQEYSIVSAEYKTWFTNSRNYLKGMRIDSVRNVDNNTVYYPFKTARVTVEDAQFADTSGGSWMGKTLIETPDHFTLIENKWGDTVKIKNDALWNESWIFYQDAGEIYYEATVVLMDTMSFIGLVDSVKVIRINVKNGDSILTDDTLNGLELILSQHHGFIQTVEFYLFPFHTPDENDYGTYFDYYLNEYIRYESISKADLQFKRVRYRTPTLSQIYDYEVGDVIITRFTGPISGPYRDRRDSVIHKENANNATYFYRVIRSDYGKRTSNDGMSLESFFSTRIDSFYTVNSYLTDTALMPEEWYNGLFAYYDYSDSSYCYTSPVYQFYNNFLREEDGTLNMYESSRNFQSFKEGIGKLGSLNVDGPSGTSSFSGLIGARKTGILCDDMNSPLAIEDYSSGIGIEYSLHPNPAQNLLHIRLLTFLNGDQVILTLYDLTGRKLIDTESQQEHTTIDVTHLPDGIYLLNIRNTRGSGSRKVVIHH